MLDGDRRINMLSLCVILTRPRCAISINPPRRWRFMTATTRFPFTNGRRRDGPVVCTDSPEYPFINPSRFCYMDREREAVALSTPPSGISPSPNEFHGFRRLILSAKSFRDFLAWNVLLTVAIEWFQLNKLRGVKYIALLFIFWIDLL